ncbi:MAG: NlpC/P60 family protein [Zoogloea sp.]|uniref:NlpC/P60 family protein n=1 Tax=Zoogloea sp. TaxID=49181 RepID=UPI0026155DAD|nr:NlpC/P60 family protein [Zoogloea sp.]MDD2988931.1 NlpC/P60 family protein [Zoogloea sp.]
MLDLDQLQVWSKHVTTCYPQEACALVIDGKVLPASNTHADPTNHFRIDPVELAMHRDYQAVLHSHIATRGREDSRTPSYRDQVSQIKSNKAWGISSTDGQSVSAVLWFGDAVPIQPLEGRQYVHGVYDCWGLVRDYYRLRGKAINNYPRDNEWWDHGEALITDLTLKDEGFNPIKLSELQIGDLLTYKINSPVTNHFAVYTAQNEILHQLSFRLSGKDSFSKWRKFLTGAYRLTR